MPASALTRGLLRFSCRFSRRFGQAALIALMVCAGSPAAATSAGDPAIGFWLVQSGQAIVAIEPCAGDGLCGRLAWLKEPIDAAGALKTDQRNPDPGRRGDPLCGLSFMSIPMREAAGRWSDGTLYSPRDGQRYSVEIEALEAGAALRVRGYLGLRIFGRSQRWTRVPGDRGGCPARRK